MLTACQGKTAENDIPLKIDSVININMTFDRDIAVPVQNIAVVPNNVAPWAGSLFVVDHENTLHRGDIDRGVFRPLAKNISALAPLARENTNGILFATPSIKNGKNLIAFQEINDASDYAQIDFITGTSEGIKSLCSMNMPQANQIFGLTETGGIQSLKIKVNADNIDFSSTNITQQNKELNNCHIYHDAETTTVLSGTSQATHIQALSSDSLLFTTEDSLTQPRIFLKTGDDITAIDITGGLTTEAPKRIDSFYVIPNSLGGVLRDGALIIADNESSRLIYVSLGFLKTRLNEVAPEQEAQN